MASKAPGELAGLHGEDLPAIRALAQVTPEAVTDSGGMARFGGRGQGAWDFPDRQGFTPGKPQPVTCAFLSLPIRADVREPPMRNVSAAGIETRRLENAPHKGNHCSGCTRFVLPSRREGLLDGYQKARSERELEISSRLGKLATFYHREARRCSRGRAYLGASVMEVAAIEAALQAMCFLYPQLVKKTVVYGQKRFRGKRYKALEFSLYELIKIADELSWFPRKRTSWGGKRTTLAGFSHEIRYIRNHVHPGVWAREQPGTTELTKGTYEDVREVVEVATSWLLHRVHDSLRRHLDRKGL